MIGLGALRVVVAVFGTVVGWIFVDQIAAASDDSLEVTVQTLDAVDDLAEVVLVSTVDAVDALTDTVMAVAGSFETGAAAIDDIAALADTLGPSLADAGATVRTLERVGGQVDSVLDAMSSLPVVPSYDSENGLGATFGRLADAIGTISTDLGDTDILVEQHRTSVADVRALALDTKNDLDFSVAMMRMLIVVGGVTLRLGWVVPLWLGRSLLDDVEP